MASPIRVGVVGLGAFGSHHARHYAARPAAKLVAVIDADAARAAAAAATYGVEALAGHEALVGRVDAASVTVPASLHHKVAGDLIDAGIHVFIEKPLAATGREAADLVARAARSGSVVQVGHIERFSPTFRQLADRVRTPTAMHFVRHGLWNGRSTDVDVVLDLMIHDIDLALCLARSAVIAVEATGRAENGPVNDEVEATLSFENGIVAKLSASRVATTARRSITVDEAGLRHVADLAASSLALITGARSETIPVPVIDNLGAEIDAFLASVATREPPLCDGRAGLDAVRVADMILAAIPTGAFAPRRLQRSSP